MRIEKTFTPEHVVFDYIIDGDTVKQEARIVDARETVEKIYKFEELSEEAKEKVREVYLEGKETYIFSEDIKEDLNVLFGKYHGIKFQYSLNSCQGDGFNVYGTVTIENILRALENAPGLAENPFNYKEWRTLEHYEKVCSAISVPENNSHYCYSVADRLEIDWQNDLEWQGYKNINIDLLDRFQDFLREFFGALDSMYEKWGYEYFYEASDEMLREWSDWNGYEFDEDGDIV